MVPRFWHTHFLGEISRPHLHARINSMKPNTPCLMQDDKQRKPYRTLSRSRSTSRRIFYCMKIENFSSYSEEGKIRNSCVPIKDRILEEWHFGRDRRRSQKTGNPAPRASHEPFLAGCPSLKHWLTRQGKIRVPAKIANSYVFYQFLLRLPW